MKENVIERGDTKGKKRKRGKVDRVQEGRRKEDVEVENKGGEYVGDLESAPTTPPTPPVGMSASTSRLAAPNHPTNQPATPQQPQLSPPPAQTTPVTMHQQDISTSAHPATMHQYYLNLNPPKPSH
ncbi:hypothetical protein Pcinc_005310 [Petrolisthes cinctipes]|uniref:Uncharacterized protein n=1 Tax=Petrolisthes cinctipes TaxID=88211 RepID=A0AAE1GFE0_PETCI|nr:hypothetical protein Pcinc_005310 [Petrolisthes cinctipes]